jgi:hypothetical protein
MEDRRASGTSCFKEEKEGKYSHYSCLLTASFSHHSIFLSLSGTHFYVASNQKQMLMLMLLNIAIKFYILNATDKIYLF